MKFTTTLSAPAALLLALLNTTSAAPSSPLEAASTTLHLLQARVPTCFPSGPALDAGVMRARAFNKCENGLAGYYNAGEARYACVNYLAVNKKLEMTVSRTNTGRDLTEAHCKSSFDRIIETCEYSSLSGTYDCRGGRDYETSTGFGFVIDVNSGSC